MAISNTGGMKRRPTHPGEMLHNHQVNVTPACCALAHYHGR